MSNRTQMVWLLFHNIFGFLRHVWERKNEVVYNEQIEIETHASK